jgi:hypothetical protein
MQREEDPKGLEIAALIFILVVAFVAREIVEYRRLKRRVAQLEAEIREVNATLRKRAM